MRETWVRSLGWEDPLGKELATHSSILAWRIPWMEEPVGLYSPRGRKVRQTEQLHFHFHILTRSGAFTVVWRWTHFHILKVFLQIYLNLFWWLHIILWVDCITNYLIIYLGSIFFIFTNSKIKSNMNHFYKLKILEVGLLSKSKHILTIWMATAKLTNCYTRLWKFRLSSVLRRIHLSQLWQWVLSSQILPMW